VHLNRLALQRDVNDKHKEGGEAHEPEHRIEREPETRGGRARHRNRGDDRVARGRDARSAWRGCQRSLSHVCGVLLQFRPQGWLNMKVVIDNPAFAPGSRNPVAPLVSHPPAIARRRPGPRSDCRRACRVGAGPSPRKFSQCAALPLPFKPNNRMALPPNTLSLSSSNNPGIDLMVWTVLGQVATASP
jgi:hypothetical protein